MVVAANAVTLSTIAGPERSLYAPLDALSLSVSTPSLTVCEVEVAAAPLGGKQGCAAAMISSADVQHTLEVGMPRGSESKT